MATNAVYKVYNGSAWVEYYFKTSAAQVGVSASRKFITTSTKVNNIAFTLDPTGDGAHVDIGGVDIPLGTEGPITFTLGSTEHAYYADDTLAEIISDLGSAIQTAYDHIPAGILTTSNYADTLGSVYQAKDADLTAIAALSGTSGLLKKTAANTWSLDTTSYVPTSRTINSKALSSNVTLYGSDIALSSSNSTKLDAAYTAIVNQVNGMSKAIALDGTLSTSGYKNTEFAATDDIITITGVTTSTAVKDAAGNDVLLVSLHIGDSVFVTQTGVPDRWLSSISGSSGNQTFKFSKLETYNLAWGAVSGKPTTISGYGITDAYLDGNTVHLGSNSKTFLTAHQDISGKAPNNHASSATTYGLGTSSLYGHVKLVSGDLNGKTATDGMAASQAHTHSQYLTSHQSLASYATQTWVDTNFVRCTAGTTAPTSPSTGDIWIDTNN